MEGDGDSGRSPLKLTGEKRSCDEAGDKQQSPRKRVKMREIGLVLRSEETSINRSEVEEATDQFGFGEQKSQVMNAPRTSDPHSSRAGRGRAVLPVEAIHAAKPLGQENELCNLNNSRTSAAPESAENDTSLPKKHHKESIGLDLNVEDVGSVNQDPFSSTDSDQLKSRAVSECESASSAVHEKDPLRIWKEMKQNGFLSTSHAGLSVQNGFMASSHGGIPIPKQRVKKAKTDLLKKKMEIAKKEQVDRFTKIAAPSGLLNGLNPGIINHVRNKKQVHSIIEALVRSEKHGKGSGETKQASFLKIGSKEGNNISDLGRERLGLYQGHESSTAIWGSKQAVIDPMSSVEKHPHMLDGIHERHSSSHFTHLVEDDSLALKLSSSINASEGSSNLSNEDPANISRVSYLSVRTATVASQWLELLHQDLKGRLSALRRSKKKVKAVVNTELPFLISKEFSPSDESGSFVMKSSHEVLSTNPTAAAHQAKWLALFEQMDKALSEEERQLESSLNQVKELQLHCDHGLQHFNWIFDMQQQQGRLENLIRSEKDGSVSELAVRAAAASIYSTCSFVMSQDNVPCF
ncbi:hypothetical protein Tsubulata_020597 [Turnera subulata]|uniref:Uncharacterized protein n=1 Tax=Turnera subulata TaxID=218843 RepID=A0A9Q0G8H5_9ROSI|nr:hypothetical protein Tsubulata_020597 [Turnera subulata]